MYEKEDTVRSYKRRKRWKKRKRGIVQLQVRDNKGPHQGGSSRTRVRCKVHVQGWLCQVAKEMKGTVYHITVSIRKDQGTGARADLGQEINSISDLGNLKNRWGIKGKVEKPLETINWNIFREEIQVSESATNNWTTWEWLKVEDHRDNRKN